MRGALSAALALLLAACSGFVGPGSGVRVKTSEAAYALPGGPSGAAVQFSVRNTGSTTVVLPNCAGVLPELQHRQGGTWVTVDSGFCPSLAVYAPLLLAPGETVQGETAVSVAGQYRLRVRVAAEGGAEFSALAVSNEFVVRWLED